jgi:Rap1a immunity proteins
MVILIGRNLVRIAAVLLFLMFCPNSFAQVTTGEKIQSMCRAEMVAASGSFCAGFISGVLEEQFMWTANDTLHKRTHDFRFCLPEKSTNDQILKVFVKYLDDHPEELHKPAALLLIQAMVKAFPCQK